MEFLAISKEIFTLGQVIDGYIEDLEKYIDDLKKNKSKLLWDVKEIIPDLNNNEAELEDTISMIVKIIDELKTESELIKKFSEQVDTLEAKKCDLYACEILKDYFKSSKTSNEIDKLLKQYEKSVEQVDFRRELDSNKLILDHNKELEQIKELEKLEKILENGSKSIWELSEEERKILIDFFPSAIDDNSLFESLQTYLVKHDGKIKTKSEYDVIDKSLITYIINNIKNNIINEEQNEIEKMFKQYDLNQSMTKDYKKFLEKSKNGDYYKEYISDSTDGNMYNKNVLKSYEMDKFGGEDVLFCRYMNNAPSQVKSAEFFKIKDLVNKDFENMNLKEYVNIMGPIWELENKYRTIDDDLKDIAIGAAIISAFTVPYETLSCATGKPALLRNVLFNSAKSGVTKASIDVSSQFILNGCDFNKIDWVNVAASGIIKQSHLKNLIAASFDYTAKDGFTLNEAEDATVDWIIRCGADCVFLPNWGAKTYSKKQIKDILKKTFRKKIKDYYYSKYGT